MKSSEADTTAAGRADGDRLPVAEEFYTVQGEGFHAGRAAYFVRLAGCDAGCRWCDSKQTWNAASFPRVGTDEIVSRAVSCGAQTVVITGGEPTMHDLDPFTRRLRSMGLRVHIETSGTHPLRGRFDWVCLSPKRQLPPLEGVYEEADELKVIIENRDDFRWAGECGAKVGPECKLYLQPEWNSFGSIIGDITEYVKAHPRWLVSIQSHKFMNIP